jgi:Methyltransferase domain
MLKHTELFARALDNSVSSQAEAIAAARSISLDEFGELLAELPRSDLPNLSKVMPRNTPPDIQHVWTGAWGPELLKQSVYFVNAMVSSYRENTSKPLRHSNVLDFGCGWGRLLRLMLYYTDPQHLYGCDPWDSSLEHARKAAIPARLAKSDACPDVLPFAEVAFDLVYAFSVFTHLPERLALSCLSAIRKNMSVDGSLLITIRPVEYWLEALHPSFAHADRESLVRSHEERGFAFVASGDYAENGPTWGETSMSRDYLESLPEWQVTRMGRSLVDPYQILVWLKPV